MNFPRRLFFLLALGSCAAAWAQGTASPVPDPDPLAGLPPELVGLITGTKKWMTSVGAELDVGYKDNVLLSSTDPERSGFARYGVDLFAWHLPRGGTDYSGILSAEQTRYFAKTSVRDEATALAQGQWRYTVPDTWKFSFDLRGGFFDVAYDVSDTVLQRTVAPQQWISGTAGPTLRWSPRPWGWLEVQALGTRSSYRERSNDADEGQGSVRVGWVPGERFEFSLSGSQAVRRYARRAAFSLGGQPLNSLLAVQEREAEARFEIAWGAAKQLRTVTRLGLTEFADRVTGYHDFRRHGIRQRIDWKNDRWRVTFDGAARRVEYRNQPIGLGQFPPPRVNDDYALELHVERKLSPRWALLTTYRWERRRTNDALSAYRVNEGLLGARWSWEK